MEKRLTKTNWMKGILMALAMALALSAVLPATTYAAGKASVTVKVKSPKKDVKLSGTKLVIHAKKPITLTVKSGSKNVTAKATYKTSNKKIVSVSKKGKLTVKKNGTATITIKYKGVAKKIKVTVAAKHSWKAHKKTVTVTKTIERCNCGANLTALYEKKYCPTCSKIYTSGKLKGMCACKVCEHEMNHILKGEPSNWHLEEVTEKVTYTDYYYCSCGTKKAGEAKPK